MSDTKDDANGRRVVWDEDNLERNAEYQRLHPVTMHIDEPKTPFVHIEDEDAEAQDRGEALSWDPQVNAFAREIKEKVAEEPLRGPVAPVSKSGRPVLHPQTLTGELEEEAHERQFKKMRQAVYADEGAKFRALLAKQHNDEEEDAEDEQKDVAEQHCPPNDEPLTEKQKRYKSRGEMVHMQRMPDAKDRPHTGATPLKHQQEAQKRQ